MKAELKCFRVAKIDAELIPGNTRRRPNCGDV